ncbi:MAG: selenium-dependent xanthine dehydrogenase [marine benthic group bacterium]|nr:selenium-dependent xanthine dehydrogenase [Candidatus Benthicola marisminoris]
MPELTFRLNGEDRSVSYDDGMHLLDVLRDRCGITSPKDGCAPQGACGCCTVMVDGRAVLSCLRKPESVEGREVTTLEGVPPARRQLLADAFVREGGLQCGYCTPGIVARIVSLLDRSPEVDEEQVRKALTGHLCRCTGYQRIVDAVMTASEGWPDGVLADSGPRRLDLFGESRGLERKSTETPGGIGGNGARYRGAAQTLGDKDYVADMSLAGMLHGAVVLSRYPRARVLGLDPGVALSMPGIHRVLTADDVPGRRHVGLIRKDWPVFVAVGETTRCVGDVLALVVAGTRFEANRAAEALEASVRYEVLDAVTDPEKAIEAGSPAVHEGGNLVDVCAFGRGDVEGALSAAAHVVEHTFVTQRIEHAFLEPEACLAVPHAAAQARVGPGPPSTLKVYTQGQGVHDDQAQVASVLGVAAQAIEVELVSNGGAFGGKEDLSIQAQTALAAHLLGAPVRTILTREQSLRMHPKRHPITLHYRAGADEEGRLTAVRACIIGDTGAYASVGMKVLERAAGHSCGPYRVPAVDIEAKTVYTNNPPCGAMRGFGANQASFAIEGVMDLLAEKVGIDGYDIRERNILAPGDIFATGQRMGESCGIRETLEAVRDVYKSARHAGIGCGIKNTGIGNGMDDSGRVLLRVGGDGRLEVLTGYTEMGQGLFTILAQVVHHEAGVPADLVDVRTASDPRVVCGMTTASRATALLTAAGREAARKLAADLPSDRSDLSALAGREYHGEYVCDFTTKPGADVAEPITHMTFSYATQVVILDDEGKLERVVAAHDVGRAINPVLCAGQIEGGVHMGLGYALSEDFPCTDGVPDSLLLRDLGILKARETPEIEVILIEVPDEVGGYGSKGVGEIGLVPTAGAVAGALHAYDGKRRFRLPMTDAPAARASVPKSRREVGP